MPIGIVSDDQFLQELKDLSPSSRKSKESHPSSIQGEILPVPTRGRNNGDVNVPESIRKIIGETAVIDGRAAAINLAKDFGISPSSVSAYAKGATSTASYNSPKESIISHINKSRQRAIKKASKTLNAALGAITQEKLDYSDAKDLSGIAKDMAVVIKNLEPKDTSTEGGASGTPQFVIFAPQFRDERSFDTIHVPE
jgi:predicted transcriptional regulator